MEEYPDIHFRPDKENKNHYIWSPKEDHVNVLWNTVVLFSYLKKPRTLFDIYVSCLFLKNNINEKKVFDFTREKYHQPFHKKTIKKYLQWLEKFGFLKNTEYGYNLTKQVKNTEFLCDNIRENIGFKHLRHYYNSTLKIYRDHTFNEYKQSNFRSFRDFIMGELIARIYWEHPVTKHQLRNDLFLSSYEVEQITSAFENGRIVCDNVIDENIDKKAWKYKHYMKTSELPDETHAINKTYICTGNHYIKSFFATKSILNKKLTDKVVFNDRNYFAQPKFDLDYLISFEEKLQKRKSKCSLSLCSTYKQSYLGVRHIEFAFDWRKQNLFPGLTEKSYLDRVKQYSSIADKTSYKKYREHRIGDFRMCKALIDKNKKFVKKLFNDAMPNHAKYKSVVYA